MKTAMLLLLLLLPGAILMISVPVCCGIYELRVAYVVGVVAAVFLALVAAIAEGSRPISLALTSLLYAVGLLGLWLEATDVPSCSARVWLPFTYLDTATCGQHHSSLSISLPQILILIAAYQTYKLLGSAKEAREHGVGKGVGQGAEDYPASEIEDSEGVSEHNGVA